jgi:hypothetical protein
MAVNGTAHAQQKPPAPDVLFKSLHREKPHEQHTRSVTANPGRSRFYYWDNTNGNWAYAEDRYYAYDANGNQTQYRTGDSIGNYQQQTLTTHANDGQPLDVLQQVWNGGAWQNLNRIIYSYDADGNILLQVSLSWNGSMWDSVSKMEFAYDIYGSPTLSTGSSYFNGSWTLDYGDQFTNHYDANGNLTSSTDLTYVSGVWMLSIRDSMIWDANGEIFELIEQQYVDTAWENWVRVYNIAWHDFDAEEADSYTIQLWENNAWIDYAQSLFMYDGNGGYVQTDQTNITGPWTDAYRSTKSVDSHGNLTLSKDEYWDGMAWVVDNESDYLHTYDVNGNLGQTITQTWNGIAVENSTREDFWDYQTTTTSAGDVTSSFNVAVYPNPAQVQANIVFNASHAANVRVSLSDANGKEIAVLTNGYTTVGKHAIQLDAHRFAPGLYTITIASEDNVQTHKFLVTK